MRKKKHYTQFTCRIEDELLEEIRKVVLENDLYSINDYINECLKFAVSHMSIDFKKYVQ